MVVPAATHAPRHWPSAAAGSRQAISRRQAACWSVCKAAQAPARPAVKALLRQRQRRLAVHAAATAEAPEAEEQQQYEEVERTMPTRLLSPQEVGLTSGMTPCGRAGQCQHVSPCLACTCCAARMPNRAAAAGSLPSPTALRTCRR